MLRFFEKLLRPFPDQVPSQLPSGLFAFIWACTDGLRGYIAVMTLLTAIIGVYEALLFGVLGRLVDWLSDTEPAKFWADEKSSLIVLVSVLMVSPLVIGAATMIKYQTLFGNFPMRLRWNFHRLMLNQSMSFYHDEFAGRIATKVMQTSLAVRDTVMTVTDMMVFVVIYFATMVALAGAFDRVLLLPFLFWLLLYLASLRFFVPRLASIGELQADARSLMTGRITDAYTNIATVKLFSHARREADFAHGAMNEFLGTVYGQNRLISGFQITNHTLSTMLIATTCGAALWLWTEGQIGVGAVAAATAMALRLNGISHWVMWEMASLFEYIGTVQDGMNTLSRLHAVKDAADAKPLQVKRGDIRFESLGFGYGNRTRVLDDFSLHIRPGEKVGLVGRSGAGKSTLVNLLLRFYDLESGRILIDGQNIVHVRQDSLRAQIGMVTQDTSLLHRSVRENLVYGRPDATDAAMVAAAQRAEAHEFILGLTDPKGRKGYDAHVGERGVKLSGGQRQRVAIARVMLKDAPILLLDEATSALDSEVEAAIQSSLYRLMEGKTVLAIAHRLSTLAAMDRLVVLDRGVIVEEGSHAQLLARNGLYARLWAHQSGGFLCEDRVEAGALSFAE